MKKDYDYLIVGAGLFGVTFAWHARQAGKRCLVIDRRPHTGGGVHDRLIEGINVHEYGPHIFHTSDEGVWRLACRFVRFNRFRLHVKANYKGRIYSLPFNLNTFREMWGTATPEEARRKLEEQRYRGEIHNLEEQALSLVGLIVASPIMLVCAIAIKAEDGGHVFYKQKRLTKYGRVFEVYKFRTMKEENSIHKSVTENDDRITKVGKYLRKFRVDELPQLLNILKGDMTIVGPRPEMLENVEKYTEELPEFSYRLRMKAGLTGLAQISGKYNTSPKDKLVMDLMYIENYSIWMDIKLIFQTITVFLKASESTEAFGSQELYDFDEDRERKRKAAQEGKDAPKEGEKGKKG